MKCKACGLPAHPMIRCEAARRLMDKTNIQRELLAPSTVVHAESAPVVHKESRAGKYADPEARKAYRRKWMRDKRSREAKKPAANIAPARAFCLPVPSPAGGDS